MTTNLVRLENLFDNKCKPNTAKDPLYQKKFFQCHLCHNVTNPLFIRVWPVTLSDIIGQKVTLNSQTHLFLAFFSQLCYIIIGLLADVILTKIILTIKYHR